MVIVPSVKTGATGIDAGGHGSCDVTGPPGSEKWRGDVTGAAHLHREMTTGLQAALSHQKSNGPQTNRYLIDANKSMERRNKTLIHPCIHPSIHPSVRPSVHPSIRPLVTLIRR